MTQANPDVDRIAKIQKLLAMAENKGSTEAERESFQAKATSLMIQWGIDDAMLHANDRLKTEQITMRNFPMPGGPKYYSFELTLMYVRMAKVLGMQSLVGNFDGASYPMIIGFTSDIERVKTLGDSLVIQVLTALNAWVKTPDVQFKESFLKGSQRHKLRKSFIVSYVDTVCQRVRQAYMKQVEVVNTTTPGTDLVLVDRAKQVENWLEENVKYGKGRRRTYMTSGMNAGAQAGHQADIGQDRVDNHKANQQSLGR